MYNAYEYFKKLQEFKTDEEILAFVRENKQVCGYSVGDEIAPNEFHVYSFYAGWMQEEPEEVEELVEKYLGDRILTEEEYKEIYLRICEWMEHDTDALPTSSEYLENVLADMKWRNK